MESIQDFEDMLSLLHEHDVKYLIIGGLAFIYHAKPRYTKDMDLWIDPLDENIDHTNLALAEFGSPTLIDKGDSDQIIQIGVAPDRIDLILSVQGLDFDEAWERRIEGVYGQAPANWIDIDSLIRIKDAIDHPRHRDDAHTLKRVRDGHPPSSQ